MLDKNLMNKINLLGGINSLQPKLFDQLAMNNVSINDYTVITEKTSCGYDGPGTLTYDLNKPHYMRYIITDNGTEFSRIIVSTIWIHDLHMAALNSLNDAGFNLIPAWMIDAGEGRYKGKKAFYINFLPFDSLEKHHISCNEYKNIKKALNRVYTHSFDIDQYILKRYGTIKVA